MQDLNKYGFYSGGYIYDLLDRAALSAINAKYPHTIYKQLYTTYGEIIYYKQLCDDKITIMLRTVCCSNKKPARTYYVSLELYDKNRTKIAMAQFNFRIAKHNYCETGEKDGATKTV